MSSLDRSVPIILLIVSARSRERGWGAGEGVAVEPLGFCQECVRLGVCGDLLQSHFLNQAILMRAVAALHSSLGLSRQLRLMRTSLADVPGSLIPFTRGRANSKRLFQ